MIAVELTNVKEFMNMLLKEDVFDNFLLQEAVITGGCSYVIDGHISTGYYSEEEKESLGIAGCTFLPFSMLRGNCFDLIKGKKAPSSFKFIFLLSPSNLENTLRSIDSSYSPNDLTGVFINIRYQSQVLTLTTGVSYKIFSPDKSLDSAWDNLVLRFLEQHNISHENL